MFPSSSTVNVFLTSSSSGSFFILVWLYKSWKVLNHKAHKVRLQMAIHTTSLVHFHPLITWKQPHSIPDHWEKKCCLVFDCRFFFLPVHLTEVFCHLWKRTPAGTNQSFQVMQIALKTENTTFIKAAKVLCFRCKMHHRVYAVHRELTAAQSSPSLHKECQQFTNIWTVLLASRKLLDRVNRQLAKWWFPWKEVVWRSKDFETTAWRRCHNNLTWLYCS